MSEIEPEKEAATTEEKQDEEKEESGGGLGGLFNKAKDATEDGTDKFPDQKKVTTGDVIAMDAWKTFGEDVFGLFIQTIMFAIVGVNMLFYVHPTSIRTTGINVERMFPSERSEWPYCYTEEFSTCDANCSEPFGGATNDPAAGFFKKSYWKVAESIDAWIFRLACVNKEEAESIVQAIQNSEEAKNVVNLGNFDMLKTRFKQWMNNSLVYTFSQSRKLLKFYMGLYTKLYHLIPRELFEIISPVLFLLTPLFFLGFLMYFALAIPVMLNLFSMILNKTDQGYEWRGGFLWTLLTAAGFAGIIPIMVWFLQIIQFIGTFFVYPFFHMDEYRSLFGKVVPILFFIFNVGVLYHAFNDLPLDTAAMLIGTIFLLYVFIYWTKMKEIFVNLSSYSAASTR